MSRRSALGGALLVAAAWAAVPGCAARRPATCDWPAAVAYAASAESLGLAAFDSLPPPARRERRAEAGDWLRRAAREERAAARLQALGTAVGLAPDDAAAWLALAEARRWIGDRDGALRAVEAAEAVAARAPADGRRALRARVSTLQAWLLRDRGEWSRGLAEAESALALFPRDREATLLRGLLLGQRGELTRALLVSREIERLEPFLSDWVWIRGVASLGDGRLAEAYHWLTGQTPTPLSRSQGNIRPDQLRRVGDPVELTRYAATPDAFHRADYWNDLGLLCERLGRLPEATRHYAFAAASLPEQDAGCLRRAELPLREDDPAAPHLPVWLVFDRHLAVGSWWAYGLEAARRFERAPSASERAFWGDAAVGALSVAIRKGVEPLLARAARGRVYVQMEAYGLAEADLARALAEFRDQGRDHAPTLYWTGFLRIKGERYRDALPPLREAAALAPDDAAVWSALGFALVMTGAADDARAALDRALILDPSRTEAWYNRGLMHFNAGRWEESVLDLQRAAELAPDSAEIANLLRRAALQVQKSRRERDAQP